MKIAIIDLASIFYRLWHTNRDEVEFKIIGILKTLQYDKILVCVDAPPYKRKEVYPAYKANRDIPDPELIGCLKNVQNRVLKEGFTIAQCQGWEADDVVASLVKQHKEIGDEVFVYGSDKDLLQCCDLINYFDGSVVTPETKFGLKRDQIVDYLALVGDTSDNIIGVDSVGDKTAKSMLLKFGSIPAIYEAISNTPEAFSVKTKDNLQKFQDQVYNNMSLIELNEYLKVELVQQDPEVIEPEPEQPPEQQQNEQKQTKNESKELVRSEVPFKHSLEPVGLEQAFRAAVMFNKSGLYPKFKGPEQIMMIVMRGRELGIGATTSLDLIEMIQGKPTMKAAGMLGLVSSNPVCEYIYCVESTDKTCTWATKRRNFPKEVYATFTIEDAKKMDLVVDGVKTVTDRYGNAKEIVTKDNWEKQPAVMLQWRCCSKLLRQVYSDLINGIYSKEEFEE